MNARTEYQGGTSLALAFKRSNNSNCSFEPLDSMTEIKNLSICNLRIGIVIENDIGIVERELDELNYMSDEPNIVNRRHNFLGNARQFGCVTFSCTTEDRKEYLCVLLPEGKTQADVGDMISYHHGTGSHLVLCSAPGCNDVCPNGKKTCNAHAVEVSSIWWQLVLNML